MNELQALFQLAISPYGGAFMLGTVSGLGVGWHLINRYIIIAKMEQSEALCEEKIAALQQRIEMLEPIANKWSQFMERRALESLEGFGVEID